VRFVRHAAELLLTYKVPQQQGKKETSMGIVRLVFAAAVALFGGAAHAQHEAPSPYSLGLSVGQVPLGLNVSVMGRAQISSFAAFGKVGTASYTRPDTALMGIGAVPASESGSGLSWGGGVSWNFTPRLTATFEWVSYDLKMPSGPLRSTSLGLQFRY
jgi:hypothetical protein